MTENRWTGSSAPYLTPTTTDPWADEAAAQGRQGSQRLVHVGRVPAPAYVAEALGLSEGDVVVVRKREILLDDRCVERADSYYPLAVADDTALIEFKKIPGGAHKALADLGLTPSRIVETVTARRADLDERHAFALDEGDPIIVHRRVIFDAAGQPYEFTDMSVADGRTLTYEVETT